MKSVSKDGVLSRRNVCGSGVSAAALLLTGCGGGGGGGDPSGGGSAGPINGGLTGNMYFQFSGNTFSVDLATGKTTRLIYSVPKTAVSPSGTYKISSENFDLSADGTTLYFVDGYITDRVTDGVIAVDIKSGVGKIVFELSDYTVWNEIRQSPDGKKFAMVHDKNGVYIFDELGNIIARYAKSDGAFNSIAWTSDNRLLYSNDGIYLTNPGDLKNASRVSTTYASGISINPANTKIAYSWGSHIWTMDISGNNVQQVSTGDNAEFRTRWSPDGQHIVFKSEVYGTNASPGFVSTGNIYYLTVVPADGKLYTFKKKETGGSVGAGTITGFSAGAGVIELEFYEPEISYTSLNKMAAYDMIWR
jgi:WD40-like Beta Propeller Repeat